LGLAILQRINFSHKIGEAVRQRLLGIISFSQQAPDFC